MTFDALQQALSDIADALPEEIFSDLNGGILLLPEERLHPDAVANDLYIFGEYRVEPRGMGRYVVLYYGSIARMCEGAPDAVWTEKAREVLYHELTHHLENMAGDKTLEQQDEADMAEYEKEHEAGGEA